MDTLFDIITTALSSNSLASVTRTNPANYIQHIEGEETETIFAFNKARDLCNLAVVNNLPIGTHTNIVPITDLSITAPTDGCADVKSAITALSKIITDAIDNPSTLPIVNTGNYPLVRTGTAIGGLTNSKQYYINYVDANTIEQMAAGRVFNPFSEQIFKSMAFRTHSINFKMLARSQQEAREIKSIIQWIKEGATPEIQKGDKSSMGALWDATENKCKHKGSLTT